MMDDQTNQAFAQDATAKSAEEGGESTAQQVTGQPSTPATEPLVVKSLPDEEEEYTPEERETLRRMYEETLSDFVEGEVVVGKILAVGEKEVAVDVGFKSEGTIPIEEFSNPAELKVGDDVEVVFDQVEDQEGQLVLSKRKADFMKVWERVKEAYEKGEVLRGRCVRRIKGGLVVDIDGVDAFLPGSQIDVRPVRDFDAYIGQTLDLKVVKINYARKNIVVSHRVLVEEAMAGQRQKILAELERGQVLEGTVKNITDFGVFIDLGGVDGLLHVNDLSWGRVNHPSEVVSLDQKIKVVVLDFNEQKDRISLGYKQLQPHPWEDVDKKYPVGSIVQGKVVSISDYGAFVELEKGVEGLVHISEMSWTQHVKHPSKIVSVGEIIQAKVLNVQKEERKISLGLKQLQPDPWETLAERYPVGSIHKGKVRNLTNFGAFVELEEGIDGLVHISDLSWTKKVRHPGEVIKKGEEITVTVLKVDPVNRRISLGYKQTQENPWDRFEEMYRPGTIVTGKVTRLIEKGLLVELPGGVEGFVPLSHLAKPNLSKPADGYHLDEEIELCVIEFSKDNKRIVLSEKRAMEKAVAEHLAGEAAKEQPEAEAAEAPSVSEMPGEAVGEPSAEELPQVEVEVQAAGEQAPPETEGGGAPEAAAPAAEKPKPRKRASRKKTPPEAAESSTQTPEDAPSAHEPSEQEGSSDEAPDAEGQQ
ncbi:MAG: 30S ribosomal protein S1 [candidate division KSB1 bacterium]|nr:30S ribosomal protein S1 [candidate division KSB1 bacterium]